MKKIIIFLFTISFFISGCKLIGKLESVGCGILPQGSTREHCFQDAAVRMSHPATCDRITGYGWEEGDGNPRRNKCYRRLAVKLENPSLCENLEPGRWAETKQDCYISVAVATKNPMTCDFIEADYTDPETKQPVYNTRKECYNKVGSAPVYCAGISGNKLIECLSEQAFLNDNIAICEKTDKTADCIIMAGDKYMNEKGWRIPQTQCNNFNDAEDKYFCFFYDAFLSGQKSDCNYILEPKYKKICEMLSTYNNVINFQDKKTSSEYKNSCNTFEEPWKALCLYFYADKIFDVWEGAVINLDFDYAENTHYRDDAYKAWLVFCEHETDEMDKVLTGSSEPFELMCVEKLMVLSSDLCRDLSNTEEQRLCRVFSSLDTGKCENTGEYSNVCKEIVKGHEKVNACKEKQDKQKILDCEWDVKNALAMELLTKIYGENPYEGISNQIMKKVAEGLK
jgi:hypothetical protein